MLSAPPPTTPPQGKWVAHLSKRPVDGRGAGHGDAIDYKGLYGRERARLTKPWDAFEEQGEELRALREERGDVEAMRPSGAPEGADGQAKELERFAQTLVRKEEQPLAREETLRRSSGTLDREREERSHLKASPLGRISKLERELHVREVGGSPPEGPEAVGPGAYRPAPWPSPDHHENHNKPRPYMGSFPARGVRTMDEPPMVAPASDYRKEFERERQRLTQLYDAYELQEKELASLKEKLSKQEEVLSQKEGVIRSLREVLAARDAENRELHIELTGLRTDKSTWEPRIKELEAKMRLEQDRFGNLFKLAMDLDAELKEAKSQIDARDRWYKKNILVMNNIKRAMDEHDQMISDATGRPYEADLEGELMRLKGSALPREKKGI